MDHGRTLEHGGDLAEAMRLFPAAPLPWLDLSTGISPYAYPLPPLDGTLYTRLPSRALAAELEAVAARAYGTALTPVAAPGTQILIELLPRLKPVGRVAVLGPTYGEHAHSWRKLGHDVREVTTLDATGDADVVVIVNPNNPDGRIVPADQLQHVARDLAGRGGWLVVDEAFCDLEPIPSLAENLPANALVLRSFGKSYGLAGVRLGFLMAHAPLADAMRQALGPWAVSGAALAIGIAALSDHAWLEATRARLAATTPVLDAALAPFGTVSGTHLFRLLEAERAPALFDSLGQNGIFVRRFDAHPRRLRFGMPSEGQLPRLLTALKALD